MRLIPDPKWLDIALAAFLLFDVVLSIRPPAFIRDCLNGVHYPEEWWWTLIVIKCVAVAGLLIGLGVRGVATTATAGVIVYFLSASYAHIRARFLRQEFWLNCLGMLGTAIAVFIFAYIV